jgi:hypothetical protein
VQTTSHPAVYRSDLTLDEIMAAMDAAIATMPDRIGPWFIAEDGRLHHTGGGPAVDEMTWRDHREAIRVLSRHPRARFKVMSDGLILVNIPIDLSVEISAAPRLTEPPLVAAYSIPTMPDLCIIDDPPPSATPDHLLPVAAPPPGPNKARRKSAALARHGAP